MTGRQTERKRCIWGHHAICTGGLKKWEYSASQYPAGETFVFQSLSILSCDGITDDIPLICTSLRWIQMVCGVTFMQIYLCVLVTYFITLYTKRSSSAKNKVVNFSITNSTLKALCWSNQPFSRYLPETDSKEYLDSLSWLNPNRSKFSINMKLYDAWHLFGRVQFQRGLFVTKEGCTIPESSHGTIVPRK